MHGSTSLDVRIMCCPPVWAAAVQMGCACCVCSVVIHDFAGAGLQSGKMYACVFVCLCVRVSPMISIYVTWDLCSKDNNVFCFGGESRCVQIAT